MKTTENSYHIFGRGFHAGYLSIKEDGTRVWSDRKQVFKQNEIEELIKILPKYIKYTVYDTHNTIVYRND